MKENTKDLVSFVIVGWNNKSLLDECFASIEEQTYKSHTVIYVDNGSTDDSLAYVKKRYPKIITLDPGENTGFAIGNNMGIKKAFENKQCRYVALLNTDARIAEDWLESLVGFAQSHPKGASFQSPTFDYYDHDVLDSFGITIDHYGQAVQLGHRQETPSFGTKKVFGVNAAAAMYSREFLDKQPFGDDYFDSDMWMYLEDVDLAARATVMGWENWFVNTSSAYHMGSASSSKNPGFSVYMVYRNNLPVLIKNLPLSVLVRLAPGLVATDIRSLYRLWRGKNYQAFRAVIRGRLSSMLHLFVYIKKRSLLRKKRDISSKLLWHVMAEE